MNWITKADDGQRKVAWRLATFGQWLPTTATAKSQGLPTIAGFAKVGALIGYAGWPIVLVGAVLVGALGSVLVSVLAALGDIAGGLPVSGSLWFGASWLGLGLVGSGIGVVAAQLSPSARTCGATASGRRGRKGHRRPAPRIVGRLP